MRNIAIVTGASSGIGEAFVREIVNERSVYGSIPFQEIWIIARREDRLNKLRDELDPERIVVLPIDLAEPSDMKVLEERLAEAADDIRVGLIVNCAGIGKRGLVEDKDAQVIEDTVDINCTCLSKMVCMCLPYMIDRLPIFKRGDGPRIINIASSAAFTPQPGFAAYAASKAYVVSFSRAIDIELMRYHIAVTTVCPGPVKTEFQSLATDGKQSEFSGFRAVVAADPVKLARKSLKASRRGRHLLVYGFSQKALHVMSKIVPTYWIIWLENKFSYVPSEYELSHPYAPAGSNMYDPITLGDNTGAPVAGIVPSDDVAPLIPSEPAAEGVQAPPDAPVAITTEIGDMAEAPEEPVEAVPAVDGDSDDARRILGN